MEGNVLEGLFSKRKKGASEPVSIPAALQPEDPVNYNSVLDYLVGLSAKEYKQMTGSVDIYREANQKVAKLIGVKDEPTTTIKSEKAEISDDEMDDLLNADPKDLQAAFIADGPEAPKAKKAQSTAKKIEIADK